MGAALDDLDTYLGAAAYTPFLSKFCDHYAVHTPKVASADTSAPAFITYAMQVRTGKPEYKALTDKVLNYIKTEPRIVGDAVNHLGNSIIGKFYPKSIWVDSLMMFSVFPAIYARDTGDKELLDIAARQPALYAGYMMDKDDGLWYHSYWVKKQAHYPKRKIFWARGNGWVISALPKILDCIGEHPERDKILDVLKRTAAAVLKYQREDGAFDTLLSKNGKTYRELSATALIADGLMHSVRKGYLDSSFLQPALKAYKAVDSSIIITKSGKVFMPEISGPTIPLPLLPRLGYACIVRAKNLPYGIAAYIWAAIQYDMLLKEEKTNENS